MPGSQHLVGLPGVATPWLNREYGGSAGPSRNNHGVVPKQVVHNLCSSAMSFSGQADLLTQAATASQQELHQHAHTGCSWQADLRGLVLASLSQMACMWLLSLSGPATSSSPFTQALAIMKALITSLVQSSHCMRSAVWLTTESGTTVLGLQEPDG